MQVTYPSYYPNFQCTASACSDSCCIGWEIDIDQNTHARYRTQTGEFGARLRGNISEEAPPHFLLQNERCPFLNEKNLCDIILTLGEDALCEICDQHPRFHEWFGDVKESGVGLCCEAAAKLILQHGQPVTFFHTETDEAPFQEFSEEPLFLALRSARDWLLTLLQNWAYPIWERLGAALLFACGLQNCLDGEAPAEEISAFTAEYQAQPAFFLEAARNGAFLLEEGETEKIFSQILSFFQSLEPIDESWPDRLRTIRAAFPALLRERPSFLRDYQPRIHEYEQLAVYFVYRYLLKAVYDRDALAKIKLMVVSVLLLSVLDTALWRQTGALSLDDQVQIVKNYSKEIEYCEENLFRFWDASWEEDFLSAENLLGLLKPLEHP